MKTIAVALDGSAASSSILLAALPLAKALDASLVLLHVSPQRELPPWLEKTAAELKAVVELRTGDPAGEVLSFTRETSPALLALATHGRRGLDRLRLGSVAEEVLRGAEVPLLVARPETAGTRGRAILVALDGSPQGEAVLADVLPLAKALGRPLSLLRVALPVVTAGGLGEFPMYFPTEDPTPYLEAVCARVKAAGVEARPVALSGRAATELLRHAEEAAAGLICMTTHGRSGLRRALMGSIAEEILRRAPCPVLVRRSAGAAVAAAQGG